MEVRQETKYVEVKDVPQGVCFMSDASRLYMAVNFNDVKVSYPNDDLFTIPAVELDTGYITFFRPDVAVKVMRGEFVFE